MRAYSPDLRQRILQALDQGRSRAEVVSIFQVSSATIKRYLKQRRETGQLAPKAIPGRPAKKGVALVAELRTQLEAHPDATLEEHCQLWEADHGLRVSTATMSRAIRQLGWTRKKPSGQKMRRSEVVAHATCCLTWLSNESDTTRLPNPACLCRKIRVCFCMRQNKR